MSSLLTLDLENHVTAEQRSLFESSLRAHGWNKLSKLTTAWTREGMPDTSDPQNFASIHVFEAAKKAGITHYRYAFVHSPYAVIEGDGPGNK